MQDADNAVGPVAGKVLAALDKERKRKLIDFEALRLGAERTAELERGVIGEDCMMNLDPLHAVYAYAQNKMSVLVEHLVELPACAKLMPESCWHSTRHT